MENILNIANVQFKSIDPNEINNLSNEEQFQILFDGKNDRIGFISNEQIQVIHPVTINLFLQSSINDIYMEEKLVRFIQTLNFQYLSIECLVLIFAQRKDIILKSQIQQIMLPELRQNYEYTFHELIMQKYFNFSLEQLLFLVECISLKKFKIKLNKKLNSLINILKNAKEFAQFNIYFLNPGYYSIQKDVLDKMPQLLKILYLVNNANDINDDLKNCFQISIEFLFKNPSLFCIDTFSILINKWPKEIINQCLKMININEFPKMILFDLLQKYELESEISNQFETNDLIEVKNHEQHLFLFKTFIKSYISTNNIEKIQQIQFTLINQSEIDFIILECADKISKDQIQKINVNIISEDALHHLVKYRADDLSPDQIDKLNFVDAIIAQNIIMSKNINMISEDKFKKIEIKNIENDAIRILIKFLYDQELLYYLTQYQIMQIDINSIDDISLQIEFIKFNINNFSCEQISKIIFTNFKKTDIVSIINILKDCKKLNCLNQDQIKDLDIFEFDENILETLLKVSSFAKFLTNNQCQEITKESIPLIDFGNVEVSFLNYMIEKNLNLLNSNQIKQLNINNLNNNAFQILLNYKGNEIEDSQILNVNIRKISKESINLLVSTKYSILSTSIIKNLPINKLEENQQLLLLQFKIDDISDEQIPFFNTASIQIAIILIDKKFELMNQDQIDIINISLIEIEQKAKILNKNNKFFKKLDERIIQNVDLNEIKSYDYTIYYDLIMIKTEFLSIEQLMSIDWLDDSHCSNHKLEFSIISRFFLESLNKVDFVFEKLLLDGTRKIIMKKHLENTPPEIVVAILNPRIIHEIINQIPTKIDYYLPAIKLMFNSAHTYSISVEYIINNWTEEFHDEISPLIPFLTTANFSEETVSTLLSNYLMELNDDTLKNFNLAGIKKEVVENAIIDRAFDFNDDQVLNSTLENSKNISEQLHQLKENLNETTLKNIHPILINFLVKNKKDVLNDHQITDIDLIILRDYLFDIFFNSKLDKFNSEQINQIIQKLNKKQLNELMQIRSNDINSHNVNIIKSEYLTISSLNIFIGNKMN